MIEQSDEIYYCAKKASEVRKSLQEIAQDSPPQARFVADKLIREMDPNGDILTGLVSSDQEGTLSEKFGKLVDTFSPETAATVAFTACLGKSSDKGR